MRVPDFVHAALPLLAGLVVGGAGATLFVQSQTGAEGTPEQRANKLALDLKRAQTRVAELEASLPQHGRRPRASLAEGMRNLADDIREGRPVSPDEIFRSAQPFLRDMAPLFERARIRAEKQMIDSMTGEMTRKYGLDGAQQAALKKWFEQKTEDDAKSWTELVGRKGTTLADLAKESRDIRPDKGLDTVMEGMLTGDKLAEFKTERSAEKAQRVQREADMRVERLNSIVPLDDGQREQVFGIMARSAPDYDPAMKLEGAAGEIGGVRGGSREDATLAVLRPEQRAAYQAERQRRRDEAGKDFSAMGLTLPENWDLLDQ